MWGSYHTKNQFWELQGCINPKYVSHLYIFMHLADAFLQRDVKCIVWTCDPGIASLMLYQMSVTGNAKRLNFFDTSDSKLLFYQGICPHAKMNCAQFHWVFKSMLKWKTWMDGMTKASTDCTARVTNKSVRLMKSVYKKNESSMRGKTKLRVVFRENPQGTIDTQTHTCAHTHIHT